MFSFQFAVYLTFIIGIVSCVNIVCKQEDQKCISDLAQKSHLLFVSGVPGKVEASEPVHIDEIAVKLVDPMLNFTVKFKDVNLHGFKDCIPSLVKIDTDQLVFFYHMQCPYVSVTKEFNVNGQIANYPVVDTGKGNLIIHELEMKLDGHLSVNSENGKKYYQVTNIVEKIVILGDVIIELESYTKENNEKYELPFKYLRDNARSVQKAFQPYTTRRLLDKFIKNINDYMRVLPDDVIYFNEA